MKNIFLLFFCVTCSFFAQAQGDTLGVFKNHPNFVVILAEESGSGDPTSLIEKIKKSPLVDSMQVLGNGKDTLWCFPQMHSFFGESKGHTKTVENFQQSLYKVLLENFYNSQIFMEHQFVGGEVSKKNLKLTESEEKILDSLGVVGIEEVGMYYQLQAWMMYRSLFRAYINHIKSSDKMRYEDFFSLLRDSSQQESSFKGWVTSTARAPEDTRDLLFSEANLKMLRESTKHSVDSIYPFLQKKWITAENAIAFVRSSIELAYKKCNFQDRNVSVSRAIVIFAQNNDVVVMGSGHFLNETTLASFKTKDWQKFCLENILSQQLTIVVVYLKL